MNLSDELAGDYATFAGLEMVTFTPASGSPIEDIPALRHAQRKVPLAPLSAPFAMEPIEATFSLFAALLGTRTPAAGDTLLDATGATWTITSTERLTLASRWRVVCRQQIAS